MDVCWDESADVTVAGAGLAGLMAGLAAARTGAKVVVLEKAEQPGGKSAIAIGSFTASETAMQRAAGIHDTHAEHLDDMARLAKTIGIDLDRTRARMRIEEDNKTLAELIRLGTAFSGPHPEEPHSRPRMHNVLPGPKALTDSLSDHARRAGVILRTQSTLIDVVLDVGGAVAGALVDTGAGTCRIQSGAIVFAAGDFVSNPALIQQLSPRSTLVQPILPQYLGEQHLIALRIGARLTSSDRLARPVLRAAQWPHVQPSPALFASGAVVVDRTGVGRELPAKAANGNLTEDEVFIIVDRRCAARLAKAADDSGPGRDGWQRTGKAYIGTAPAVAYAYLDDCAKWNWHAAASTLAAAAHHLGCPEAALGATLGDAVTPLHILGPFQYFLTTTRETIATDDALQVLSGNDQPIPGLYAAGDTTKWFEYAGGHGYGLSWAATSGRLAGARAARYVREQKARL